MLVRPYSLPPAEKRGKGHRQKENLLPCPFLRQKTHDKFGAI